MRAHATRVACAQASTVLHSKFRAVSIGAAASLIINDIYGTRTAAYMYGVEVRGQLRDQLHNKFSRA